MSTAGQLAAESGEEGEGGALIEAIYPIEVPMSLPLDARLPREKVERGERALARARQVGQEYEGVEVATTHVRGRTLGSTIVEEARRRGVDVIVIGAEPPSAIRGGGLLGGIAGTRPRELGEVTAYVLEKAPCRVLVTAPPDGRRAAETAPDGAAGREGASREP
jgi:APA family basic amino acid/polyamine antiporter